MAIAPPSNRCAVACDRSIFYATYGRVLFERATTWGRPYERHVCLIVLLLVVRYFMRPTVGIFSDGDHIWSPYGLLVVINNRVIMRAGWKPAPTIC